MATFAGKAVTTLAVSLCLVASVASAGIAVPTANSTGVWTPVLAAGQEYLFVASGTYTYRWDGYWADAEFSVGPEVPGVIQEVYQNPAFSLEKDTLDLLINLTAVDWLGSGDGNTWAPHTYSPDHVYRYYYTGPGSAVRLSISDWYPFYEEGGSYSDNAGSLNVEITAIPEPASLIIWFLLGATGITVGWWQRRWTA